MSTLETVELPVAGMDCTECTMHVQHAIERLPGVADVTVLLSSEKAIVRLDPGLVDLGLLRQAVEGAGYKVGDHAESAHGAAAQTQRSVTRRVLTVLALVFGAVLLVVVVGEWLGLLDALTDLVPFPIGVALVIASGWPIFRNVVVAASKRQVTSHTLMTLGVVAALAVGQWATAAVVVFFMRIGDFVEHQTAEGARRAVRDLAALAPQTARIERDGSEEDVTIAAVRPGDVVIVRPGEALPVDGDVIGGQAAVDQATITGESLPVEAGPGAEVFAATLVRDGMLRVRTTRVGPDTTFGRVVKLVEEAEAHRADVQRFADKFSAWYLPVVAGLAAVTYLVSRNPLSTASVLLVACSCSIALATPIAVLASVGTAARRGILVKGGKYLEALAQATVVLIDKTGTLTLGLPQITDVVALDGWSEDEVLALAASAERYSEHPLAGAVRRAAQARGLALHEPAAFRALPGQGVEATVDGQRVEVGNQRLFPAAQTLGAPLAAQGKTLIYVGSEGAPIGLLAAADTLRPEVPAALERLRGFGLQHIELLTGDNERTAADLAGTLGVAFQANLLPEDKIRIVREHQARGATVVMVGDGVNDAPALAQADVGIAMGAAGAGVALEAAHVALMRDDWTLVPEVFAIARRTMGVVKGNLWFTALYNGVGLTLAAFGFLPPILAAALQTLPDLGILGNSARLLRNK